MGVWVHGCMRVWVYECMCVYGRMGVWVYVCVFCVFVCVNGCVRGWRHISYIFITKIDLTTVP